MRQGNHVFLGGISSTTFEDSQRPFQITYGTGAVVGTIVRDNLKLAGLSLDGHIFGVAHNESKEFAGNDVAFDGILGTAQSTLSNQKTPTAVEALAQNGLIQDPITSYKISRLDDQKNDGVITFGGLDETKFDPSTLVTVDNLSRVGFWEAAMDRITVDGADTRLTRRTAILDTGTTLILAPDADARALHQAIPGARSDGQGGFIIPCTTNATIALTFGGREFTIDPRDLVFAPLNLNDPTGDCFSGITSGSIGGANQWLVRSFFRLPRSPFTDLDLA
ncbi:aspartic peptidase [Salix suchowensis]|nr:aspartic peptidase [Salix suchowensis]